MGLLRQRGDRQPRRQPVRSDHRSGDVAAPRRYWLGKQSRRRQLAPSPQLPAAARCMECLGGRLLPAVTLWLRTVGISDRTADRHPEFRHRQWQLRLSYLVNRPGDPDRVATGDLAVELGRPPLALGQAAACMQATGTPLARSLPLFRDRQADLLARDEASGHPSDVATTLGLALSRLRGRGPQNPGALSGGASP